MTREECLKVVQAMWQYKDCGYSEYKIMEALDGVLRALEQDPMTKLERIKENISDPKWIPVSERLPKESLNSVIGWDMYRERCVFVQYIDGHFQIMGSNECFDIVAWIPLPKPYKEKKESEE